MVDTKKEQERDELHRAIWAIADELRGAVDGWDFKNYVLGTMFYRYISENLCNYINSGEIDAGNTDFDFAKMPDEDAEEAREGLVEEKGFFILPSELFCNVRANAANDENLNETLERVFRHIEESAKGSEAESDFAGLFDDYDVNSNKLGSTVAKRNEKLVKLLNGVGEMNLGDVKDHSIDAFGDAYEYLMTMYASNAGKSGGEFFTPADVSELLTRLGTVGKTEINKVYDPACGSGSLLLKAEKILGKDAIRNGFYGQEINITTYNLCRINMFLHDVGFDKFDIACEDTLLSPQHWDDEPFELINKAIDASPELRSKKQLIETFIAGINDVDDVMNEWHEYVVEQRDHDLNAIITEEKLKPEDTRKFMENAFRDGEIKTAGTDIDKLMPPISRFGGGGRAKKKQGVIDKLKTFFEKYFGIGGSSTFTKPEHKTVKYSLDEQNTLSMVAESKTPYGNE